MTRIPRVEVLKLADLIAHNEWCSVYILEEVTGFSKSAIHRALTTDLREHDYDKYIIVRKVFEIHRQANKYNFTKNREEVTLNVRREYKGY